MDAKIKSYFRWLAYAIGVSVIILEVFRILILTTSILDDIILFNTSLTNVIRYTESILVSVGAIFIRISMDSEKLIGIIRDTDIEKESGKKNLNASLFLNFMPIAMILCTTADFVLGEIDFIPGLLTFLLAQVFLIVAFSGLIHINGVFRGKIKILAFISTLALFLVFISIYILIIYSPEDILTIIVIPYLICIMIMTLCTFFALGYVERDLMFRIMLAIGGLSFLVSDAMLGIRMFLGVSHFITPPPISNLWVMITYNLAIFSLQYAIVFLKTKKV